MGNSQWFMQLLEQLGHEVWIGDAGHILKLLVEDRFPRIWVPEAVMRDQRQLLRLLGKGQVAAFKVSVFEKVKFFETHQFRAPRRRARKAAAA